MKKWTNIKSILLRLQLGALHLFFTILGNEVNSQKMDYTENGPVSTCYVWILRLAYTKSSTNQHLQIQDLHTIRHLTCKTFVPVQLTDGCCSEYESLFFRPRKEFLLG